MKNVMTMLMLVVVIGLVAGPASAALVNTTFEENSAGTGSWDLDGAATGVWDEKDIASGELWTVENVTPVFADSGYNSSQSGRLNGGSSSTDAVQLDFGSGGNTGTYQMSYYMKFNGNNNDGGYGRLRVRDDDDDNATTIYVYDQGLGGDEKFLFKYYGTSLTTVSTLGDYGTWYKIELELRYSGTDHHKFDLKITDTRDNSVLVNTTNEAFQSASSNSLDRLYMEYTASSDYQYFDDIYITPEPATMTLLLLGLPFALRRKQR